MPSESKLSLTIFDADTRIGNIRGKQLGVVFRNVHGEPTIDLFGGKEGVPLARTAKSLSQSRGLMQHGIAAMFCVDEILGQGLAGKIPGPVAMLDIFQC